MESIEMEEQNIVREHSFDDIEEYDNNLPNWWVWSFVLCVVWAGAYGVYYHVAKIGELGAPRLETELLAIAEARAADAPSERSAEELVALSHDALRIQAGAALYTKANCQACHSAEAYGLVGPNLRDDYWIYGNTIDSLVETLREGRQGKTAIMLPQGNILSRNDMYNVAAYIVDLNRKTEKKDHKTEKGLPPAGDLAPIEY